MLSATDFLAGQGDLTQNAFRCLNAFVEPAVKAGLGNPLPVGAGVVVLETTGRISGEKRRVPVMASRVGSTLGVSTVRSNSQWLRNIEADPSVTVYLFGSARAATATVTRGALNTVTLELES